MDDQPKPPLADDPNFISSLGDLDRGMDHARDGVRVQRPPIRPPARQAPPAAPRATSPASVPRTAQPAAPSRPAPIAATPRAAPAAVRPASPTATVAPVNAPTEVPRQGGTRRRALLDLFPPAPGETATSPAAPAPQSAPPASRPAPPARPQPVRAALLDAIAPPLEEAITYETFYGLREKPFSLSSDPRFLYHSTAHDRVAQELLSAIRRRDGLVIITGQTGMGKTMLCRAVMDQLDRRTLTSFVADPSISIEEVLKTTLIDFGVITRADAAGGRLARASRKDLSTALREFLTSLAPLQAFAVVVIDEAHKLTIEDLEEIRTLYEAGGSGEERLLQFVLVGKGNLLSLLRRSEVRGFAEQASVRCELEPLAEDEIVGYVLHRLAVAGTNARIDFEDTAIDRLSAFSGGVPRVINLLCDHALKLGHDASASVIDAAMIDRAADDLNIEAPQTHASRLVRVVIRNVMTIAALALLALVGAGAAAFVFHDRLAQVLVRWESVPAPPRPPALRQPAPLKPGPPPPLPGERSDAPPSRPPG